MVPEGPAPPLPYFRRKYVLLYTFRPSLVPSKYPPTPTPFRSQRVEKSHRIHWPFHGAVE